MANENVKIIINERDNTVGAAAPIDSTDIAFVPGFATKGPKNEPILCNTEAEFVDLFGDTPCTFASSDLPDVATATALNIKVGDYDLGYIFARELLASGMPVVYVNLDNSGAKIEAIYGKDSAFEAALDLIADKSAYSVKYITSGGYPAVTINEAGATDKLALKMMQCAADRGDAVAIINDQCNTELDCKTAYEKLNTLFVSAANTSFGTFMYPWATYTCVNALADANIIEAEDYNIAMPASYAYLKSMAAAIKTCPNWLAIAGVTRGIVPQIVELKTPRNMLSNTIAEHMQPKYGAENNQVSINCITDVRPYGLTLWGNRTLKPLASNKGTTALHFLNTRNMLSDIKKVLYTTAKSIMFEQNSDTLWLRFKSGVSGFLNQLKLGNGISDFKIIKTPTAVRGQLAATIKVYPVAAVEYFELTVEINDQDVVIS